MAVNCFVVPSTMLAAAGVTPIDTKVAGVTVSVTAGDVTPPSAAVICEAPVAALVAKPFAPLVLLIVATVLLDDVQVTLLVTSCVLLSVYTPTAVNGCVVPSAIVGAAGVTPIDTKVAAVMVMVVVPETPALVAVMVVEPDFTALTRPAELTVAICVLATFQVTVLERSCLLPSP